MDFSISVTFWICIGVLLISIYIQYKFIKKNYLKVPPNKLAIIYGRSHEMKDSETGEKIIEGYRIIKGGATFIMPVLEAVEYLDLTVRTITIELQNIKNKAGEYITLQAYIVVGFQHDYKAWRLVAEYFGEGKEELIQTLVQKIASHQIKTSLYTKALSTIIDNQVVVNEEIKTAIDKRVQKMGLEILDFSIQEVNKK